MSEILVAPREDIAQLKQSYEPIALNSVFLCSLRLRENRNETMATRRVVWNEVMEAKLVELWQQHTSLYDVSSSTYHDRNAREKGWEEIAAELHLPGKFCNVFCCCSDYSLKERERERERTNIFELTLHIGPNFSYLDKIGCKLPSQLGPSLNSLERIGVCNSKFGAVIESDSSLLLIVTEWPVSSVTDHFHLHLIYSSYTPAHHHSLSPLLYLSTLLTPVWVRSRLHKWKLHGQTFSSSH